MVGRDVVRFLNMPLIAIKADRVWQEIIKFHDVW